MARTKQQQRMIDLRTKVAKMTQQKFAEFVGCTQANIGHYENRSQVPSIEAAKRIMLSFKKIGIIIRYEHIYGLPEEK